MDEEDVGDPDLLHETSVEGAALVAAGGERQPVVLPVVPQVQSHGEILNHDGQVEVEKDGDEQSRVSSSSALFQPPTANKASF